MTKEIASVAQGLGCYVINRPTELATDTATSEDALPMLFRGAV